MALSHFKWVDSHPSTGGSQTTFPSLDAGLGTHLTQGVLYQLDGSVTNYFPLLDGRGLRGG
jgi:hypothetical protein